MTMCVRQRDATDCGAACLVSVAAHYGLKLPVARVRQLASTDRKGTNVLGLAEAAQALGFTAKGVKGAPDCLNKIPVPAIAHVLVRTEMTHYVVIYGVTKNYVRIMDPAEGALRKRTRAAFEKEWTGVLVLLAPVAEFAPGDATVGPALRFWQLVRPHASVLCEAFAGALVTTVLGLSSAIYIQKIMDNVIVGGNRNLLNLMSVAMLCIIAAQFVIGALRSLFTMRTGEIIARIGDAVKIRAFINDVALNLVLSAMMLVFALVMISVYAWRITLVLLPAIPVYVALYWLSNMVNRKYVRTMMERAADVQAHLVESLNAVGTVKQLCLEWQANIKTETRFVQLLKTIYTAGTNGIWLGGVTDAVTGGLTVMVLWAGAGYVLDSALTPGELMSCYALLGYFTGPVSALIGMNRTIQDAVIAADRLFEIMDLAREEAAGTITLTPEMAGDIVFDEVTFRYGTCTDVFDKLSLRIPHGAMTAIVGESGSGKTTLFALLLRMYPLRGGRIRIGAYDISMVRLDSVRAHFGVVPQNIDLFAGTVAENIAAGEFEPDMRRVLEVCHVLSITEMIEKLPQGYATPLGENGVNVSGGEKQHIAIARALYRDPEVLLLDEASAFLNSISEQHVQRAIDTLSAQGKTVVVIAHRLSTVQRARSILVLKEGTLVEEGTHEALLSRCGEYFRLWRHQGIMASVPGGANA